MSNKEHLPGIMPDQYFDSDYWKQLHEQFEIPAFPFETLIDVDYYLQHLPLKEISLAARGNQVALEGGSLPERLNKYLNMLIFLTGGPPGPIGLQFVAQPEKERGLIKIDALGDHPGYADSLIEDEHEVTPGLIHKFFDRVLFIVTGQCAAYCRYCTRGRLVGAEGARTIDEVDQAFAYIKAHPEIKEIIFSGGDSFILPRQMFEYVIEQARQFQDSGQIDSVRFGTRSFIHNPDTIKDWHYEGLRKIYAPNVMVHYNHPYEITTQVKSVLDTLRQAGASLHSQSVLLKGVNNDRQVLNAMFRKGQKHGIAPYYVFNCDEVPWGKGFVVPVQEAEVLAFQNRAELPGLAGRARFVIDVPQGHAKVPFNEGFWVDKNTLMDYHGQLFGITEDGLVVKLSEAEQAAKRATMNVLQTSRPH